MTGIVPILPDGTTADAAAMPGAVAVLPVGRVVPDPGALQAAVDARLPGRAEAWRARVSAAQSTSGSSSQRAPWAA